MFEPIQSASSTPSLFAFLRRRIRHLRGVSKWPTAEARILSCDWVVSSTVDGDTGEFEIQFTFDLAGTSYYGSFSLPGYGSARLFATGDIIQIRYNPKNPDQSLYSEAWSGGEILCLILLLVCLIFIGHWLVTGSPWFNSHTGNGD